MIFKKYIPTPLAFFQTIPLEALEDHQTHSREFFKHAHKIPLLYKKFLQKSGLHGWVLKLSKMYAHGWVIFPKKT